jgi:hypothetical protein
MIVCADSLVLSVTPGDLCQASVRGDSGLPPGGNDGNTADCYETLTNGLTENIPYFIRLDMALNSSVPAFSRS